MVRWGQVPYDEASHSRVTAAFRPDIYREVLRSSQSPVPEISSKIEEEGPELGAVPTTRGDLLLSSQMFMDGRSFHPDDILGYVNDFQIRNV
jgi:two-component system, oxyanion-binding sensor